MALAPVVMLLYTRTLSSIILRLFCSARLHRHELGIQLSMAPVILLSTLSCSDPVRADQCFTPGFAAAVTFDAGKNPLSIAVGDFDGDARLDLAVANSDSVSVLLGNGDGTFQTAVKYDAGSYPSSVVAGDLNGDKQPDLAVVNSDGVSVLLGNGDGTFQSAVNFAVGSAPYSLAVGDFNADGKADLAVACAVPAQVSVLVCNGGGNIQAAVHYGTGAYPDFVVMADFDGDALLDLAVSNFNSTNVSVLFGRGDGTFKAAINYDAGPVPYSVGVGDFNGDGQPDLAVANKFSTTVSVILGTCIPAPAELAVVRSNSTVTISWPRPSTGFVLESTTSLSPTNWVPAPEVPRTNNARWEVTAPLNQQERYFRLRKP